MLGLKLNHVSKTGHGLCKGYMILWMFSSLVASFTTIVTDYVKNGRAMKSHNVLITHATHSRMKM